MDIYAKRLMEDNGFSEEAVSFVLLAQKSYIRYLPLLATLANYSAKNICPSYYDLKDEMLNDISWYAKSNGWRTFQSEDGTPGFPYIYYVDTGYTPQVSFHSDRSRPTTWKGQWSRVSVQEIAPLLIRNLMKKDGFTGRVFDVTRKTVSLMLIAGLVEVDHLHNGINYKFSIENGALMVRVDDVRVCADVSTLQSIMTRLAKMIKALNTEAENDGLVEDKEADSNLTEVSPETGNTEEGSSSSLEGDGQCSAQLDKGDNFTDEQHRLKACTGEQVGEEASNNGSLSNLTDKGVDEQSLAPGSQNVDNPVGEPKTETGLNSTDPHIDGAVNLSSKGFFDLIEKLTPPKGREGSGGGGRLNVKSGSKYAKVDIRIQTALAEVASTPSFHALENGTERYNSQRLVKALITKPHSLPEQRESYTKDKVYFFVDTSGSVAEFGNFIISMIKSATKSDNIVVYSGMEACPEVRENDGQELKLPKNYWDCRLPNSLKAMINRENPPVGSTFVFWGDLQINDSNVRAKQLLSVTKYYKCIWLHSEGRRTQSEVAEVKAAKFKVLFGVNDTISFVRALKNIK